MFIVVSGVAPTKGDLLLNQGNKSMVGDSDAVGIAAQILEHIFGAAERWFAVDHPVFSEQWPEPSSKDLGLSQESQVPGEA